MDAPTPTPRRGRPAAGINPDAPAWARLLHRLCLDSGLPLGAIAERAGLGHVRHLTLLLAGGQPNAGIARVLRILDVLGRRLGDLDEPDLP